MKAQIMQMIRENQRTVKEMADALNLSKQEVFNHLSGLPVEAVRTVNHNEPGRPSVIVRYSLKKDD